MNCPTCQSTDVRPGVNGLHVCHGCGTVIGNYFPTAPVNYGKRYRPVKFTAPPPIAPEFYEQLSREVDDAINAEIQRQEQAFVWEFGDRRLKIDKVTVTSSGAIAIVWSANGDHVPHCTPPPDPLDAEINGEVLRALIVRDEVCRREGCSGWFPPMSSEFTPAQREAVSAHWSAQLRAKVPATSKPKLTVMVQVDDD